MDLAARADARGRALGRVCRGLCASGAWRRCAGAGPAGQRRVPPSGVALVGTRHGAGLPRRAGAACRGTALPPAGHVVGGDGGHRMGTRGAARGGGLCAHQHQPTAVQPVLAPPAAAQHRTAAAAGVAVAICRGRRAGGVADDQPQRTLRRCGRGGAVGRCAQATARVGPQCRAPAGGCSAVLRACCRACGSCIAAGQPGGSAGVQPMLAGHCAGLGAAAAVASVGGARSAAG